MGIFFIKGEGQGRSDAWTELVILGIYESNHQSENERISCQLESLEHSEVITIFIIMDTIFSPESK